MDEREFIIPLPDTTALRVRYLKDRGRVLRFVVQLETLIEDAFNFALQDLRTDYRFSIQRYWQWRTE